MSRLWFGRFRSGDAAIAFPRATLLNRAGDGVRQDVQWWRIKRIFGIGGKRFLLAFILVAEPTIRHQDPRP